MRNSVREYDLTFYFWVIQHRFNQCQVCICLDDTVNFADIQRPDRKSFLQHSGSVVRRFVSFKFIDIVFDVSEVEAYIIVEILTDSVGPVHRELNPLIGYLGGILLRNCRVTVNHWSRKVNQNAVCFLIEEFETTAQAIAKHIIVNPQVGDIGRFPGQIGIGDGSLRKSHCHGTA